MPITQMGDIAYFLSISSPVLRFICQIPMSIPSEIGIESIILVIIRQFCLYLAGY